MSAAKCRIQREVLPHEWNDGNKDPALPGHYLRKYPKTWVSRSHVRTAFWDGRLWYYAEVTKNGASKTPPHQLASSFQSLPWSKCDN